MENIIIGFFFIFILFLGAHFVILGKRLDKIIKLLEKILNK